MGAETHEFPENTENEVTKIFFVKKHIEKH